jgi:hypothetical protein
MRAPLIALALALLLAGPAQAQTAQEPESLGLARRVVVDSGLSRSFQGLVAQMEADLRAQTAATRPAASADLNAVLADLKPEFDAATDAMIDRASAFYAERLSRRELADIAVFFAGPSGKAYVAAQPALIGDLAGALSQWRSQTAVAMLSRVREKMREKGRPF